MFLVLNTSLTLSGIILHTKQKVFLSNKSKYRLCFYNLEIIILVLL